MENELERYVVTVDFEVDDNYDSESFLKLKLKLAHTGVCPKGFEFTKESLENAAPTIINKPILARVVFDTDNNPQFSSHDKHIEKDYKNEVRIFYDEAPIGIIPKDSEYVVEYDEESKRYYSYCIGYVWKKYSNYALDIIERDKKIKLSIEILIKEFEIDKETKVKKVTDFKYEGATLLGNNRNPGMENASATTEFELDSERINLDKQNYLNEFLEEFKKVLTEFDNSKEGGETILKEAKDVETVETKNPVVEDEQPKGEEFEKETEKPEQVENPEPTEPKEDEKEEDFELTANETRRKLCEAVNLLGRNTSVDYYLNDFDSKYIYYIKEAYVENKGWQNTTHRRSYALVDGEVTLNDDEVETVIKILTKDEWDALEKTREEKEVEFEDLKTFKETTLKEQREKALEQVFDKFDQKLIDVEAYQQLKKDNAEFSIEDVEDKCFAICGRLGFNKEPVPVVEQKDFVKAGVEETFEDDSEDGSNEDDVYNDLRHYY